MLLPVSLSRKEEKNLLESTQRAVTYIQRGNLKMRLNSTLHYTHKQNPCNNAIFGLRTLKTSVYVYSFISISTTHSIRVPQSKLYSSASPFTHPNLDK